MRDQTIDVFRGLAILLVVSGHSILMLPFLMSGNAVVVRYCPLELMGLFFFITGASNSFSGVKSLKTFYTRRFVKVLIPYWVYAFFCLAANYLLVWRSGLSLLESALNLFRWVLPLDIQPSAFPILTGEMWFMPVYIAVIAVFPLLLRLSKSKRTAVRLLPFIICVLAVFGLQFVRTEGLICRKLLLYTKETVFYSFFAYFGCFWQQIASVTKRRQTVAWGIAAGSVVALVVSIVFLDANPNMQANKFPPNLTFMLYATATLCIFYCLRVQIRSVVEKICRIRMIRWIFEQYKHRCYTIFLYHAFTVLFVEYCLKLAEQNGVIGSEAPIWLLPFTLTFTIAGSAVLGNLFGRIEDIRFSGQKIRGTTP